MYSNWLKTNERYFTDQEIELLKRRVFETEVQKEFRLWLNSNGFSGSWFSKHSDQDPYNFALSVWGELEGSSFVDGFKKFFSLFSSNKLKTKPISDKLENQIVRKGQEKARDSRNNKENNNLDNYNNSETSDYKNGNGIYNKYGMLIKMNKDIAYKHITVGYLLDTSVSSLCSSFGATLAYCDKEFVFLYNKPRDWLSYKSKQISTGLVQSYLSSSLTEHLMTIPTILIDDNVLTDQMLQNITPFIGISSGISVTALMSFIQGKRGFEIMKDTLNSGVNQALTTGVMTLTKDSFAMIALNEFSKSISTKILLATGVAFPPQVVTTIVTSFVLCATQRIIITGYNKIHDTLYLADPNAVKFWSQTNKHRIYDLSLYKDRDPFLLKRFPVTDVY